MLLSKHVSSLDFLDRTPESPQEHCHKTRWTLMSTQECKIARVAKINTRWSPFPPHLLHSYPVFHSKQYKLLDLLEESTEIPWDTRLKSIWILISVQQLDECSIHHISSQDESWFPFFDWRFEPTFHQHLKWSFPSAIGMWEGPCVFCLKWHGPQEILTQKKARLPCSGLNLGSCFMSQDEGMSESPVDTLEKTVGLRLIWKGWIISLWHLERHTEFNASKGDDGLLFLKMDRNPNINVPTRKWTLVSCFTSSCVCIVLLSVV